MSRRKKDLHFYEKYVKINMCLTLARGTRFASENVPIVNIPIVRVLKCETRGGTLWDCSHKLPPAANPYFRKVFAVVEVVSIINTRREAW